MEIIIIAAIARHNVIGKDNRLPWHLPADLQHFKDLTLNKPIIMGRNTYESIGHALPNRENIIITSSPDYQAPECKIFPSLDTAIAASTAAEIFIIGGEQLYYQALPIAHRIELTHIDADFDGDVYFPPVEGKDWEEVAREDHSADDQNPFAFSFITLKRR